jgi:hypothetical protein
MSATILSKHSIGLYLPGMTQTGCLNLVALALNFKVLYNESRFIDSYYDMAHYAR